MGEFKALRSIKFNGCLNELFTAARGKQTRDILPPLIGTLLRGDFDFELKKALINILFAPIPRGICPNKPIIDEMGIIGNN